MKSVNLLLIKKRYLEHECVVAHQIKLDKASYLRVHLHQSIANSEAELAVICSAMGEKPVYNTQVGNITSGLAHSMSDLFAAVPDSSGVKPLLSALCATLVAS